jgi:hypothetical protein
MIKPNHSAGRSARIRRGIQSAPRCVAARRGRRSSEDHAPRRNPGDLDRPDRRGDPWVGGLQGRFRRPRRGGRPARPLVVGRCERRPDNRWDMRASRRDCARVAQDLAARLPEREPSPFGKYAPDSAIQLQSANSPKRTPRREPLSSILGPMTEVISLSAPYPNMPLVGRRTRRLLARWNQKNLRSLRRSS